MGRRAGRPGRGPAPAGSRGRGDGCDSGYVVRVVGVIVVVAVLVVEIVVEVEILVVVVVLDVLVVEVFIVVEVDVVVVIGVVVIGVVVITVVEVAIVQVFFGGLARDLLLQLTIGFRVVAVVLVDRFIDILDVCRLVGFVVMAPVGRGHSLEHRMFAVRM